MARDAVLLSAVLGLSVAAMAGCSGSGEFSVCGNGIVEPGEVCDDGNRVYGDGCGRFCVPDSTTRPVDDDDDDDEDRPDAGAKPDAMQTALSAKINEFVFDHPGTDTDEFVELFSDPSANLAGMTVVLIDGDSTNSGLITLALAAGTTSAAGVWVTPFQGTMQNGTQTLLLVRDFTGATGNDLDSANDGTLDTQPWGEVLDAVAVTDNGTADRIYAGATLLPTTHPGGTGTVGGASRSPNGMDTNVAGDWVRNDALGEGLPCCSDGTMPASGIAVNTPGAGNNVMP